MAKEKNVEESTEPGKRGKMRVHGPRKEGRGEYMAKEKNIEESTEPGKRR